jgi:hypothetical protein
MADTVKVGCRLPQGVRLRVFEPGKNAFGEPQMNEIGGIDLAGSGQHVTAPGGLHAGDDDVFFNEVPSDLWGKWLKTNEGSDLVTSGAVFAKGHDPVEKDAEADEPKRSVGRPRAS